MECGKVQQRTRLLPAHVVVYFVMALAMFHDGYEEVLRRLVDGLKILGNWRGSWSVPTTGAVSQARVRLGADPLRMLFERVARPLARPGAPGGWLRSWRLMAIDGAQIDMPDTEENLEGFGKYQGGTRRPYPQIHLVGLAECGSHAIIAAELGTIYEGERTLAAGLTSSITTDMLVLADRGFYSFELWQQYMVTGAALIWRIPAGMKLTPLEVLPDGSFLSEISAKRTRGNGYQIPLSAVSDPRDATHIPVRVVEYTITGHGADTSETFRLITTILNPNDATAVELAAAYQERWEYEIALKEIQTQLLAPAPAFDRRNPSW
jgi:hypothetical protein